MSYPKKHLSRWFTTRNFRCINLDWVTDVKVFKDKTQVLGSQVYQGISDSDGQASIRLDEKDTLALLNLLE